MTDFVDTKVGFESGNEVNVEKEGKACWGEETAFTVEVVEEVKEVEVEVEVTGD